MKINLTSICLLPTLSILVITTLLIATVYAQEGEGNVNSLNEKIVLDEPFYVESYKSKIVKPEPQNQSSTHTFTAKGIINGTLDVNTEVNATKTWINNYTTYIQGNAKFVTDNEDIAYYNFEAITNYKPDGTLEDRGTAIFSDHATGELSFLSNAVAVYKESVDSSGNSTFINVAVEITSPTLIFRIISCDLDSHRPNS